VSKETDNQVHDKLIIVYSQRGGAGAQGAPPTTAVNLAATMAQQEMDALLIDWGSGGEVAAALGIQATRGLYDWLHNGDPGGSRLGYARFVQTTPVQRLAVLSGYLPVADVSDEVIDGHLSELIWASHFDYVICDAPATAAALGETLLRFRPGAVIIPVALDSMDIDQVRQTYDTVRRLSPHSQLMLAPTFLQTDWPLTVANLNLLREQFPGFVMAAQPYRVAPREARAAGQYASDPDLVAVYEEMVRWIQKGADEILFGVARPGLRRETSA